MKKQTLLAAAGIGLACAAHAQSSTTLYGLIDLNVTHFRAGAPAGGATTTAMTDGTSTGLNGSRWGIRAVEDLGGGLRAGAVAEAGVLANSGASAQGGRAFGRQIFVWLASDGIGELRLGRQYSMHDRQQGQSNPFSNGLWLNPGFGVTNMGKGLPQFIDAPRIDSMVQYLPPEIGGLSANVAYAPGANVNDTYYGLAASYATGPVYAGITHEWNTDVKSHDRTNKVTQVVGNYDFGVIKLLAGAQRAEHLTTSPGNVGALTNLTVTGATSFTATKLNAYTIGIAIPVGQLLLGPNFTRTKYVSAAGQSQTLGRLGLGVTYALSKKTFIYTSVATATGDLKGYVTQGREFQLGLRHAF